MPVRTGTIAAAALASLLAASFVAPAHAGDDAREVLKSERRVTLTLPRGDAKRLLPRKGRAARDAARPQAVRPDPMPPVIVGPFGSVL